MRKKIYMFFICTAFLSLFSVNQVLAKTVYCSNCSTRFIQLMDRVTNIDQLRQMVQDYGIYMEQLEKQSLILTESIKQTTIALKNTKGLPDGLLEEATYNLIDLADITAGIYSSRGDVVALAEIFEELYPDFESIGELVRNPDESMREYWNKMTQKTEQTIQDTFLLSSSQLHDMTQNRDDLNKHIEKLLKEPDGQMQALSAGNALGAMQVQEMRELRLLIAKSVEMATVAAMESEKEKQMANEIWDALTTVDLKDEYKDYE